MPAASVRPAVLAEDDATLRDILRQALESAGFKVAEANDGLQALAACRAARPALIVTNIALRGPEFLERARAEGIAAPALILTTEFDTTARALAAREPKVAVLKKPFPLEDFLGAIQELLGSV